MTPLAPEVIFGVFLLFCRIGGCLMVLPGYASTHLPMQVRLFMAIAVTLALAPPLLPRIIPVLDGAGHDRQIVLILSETAIGVMIGMIGRIFFMALEFVGTALTNALGFGGLPGMLIEESEPVPALATLLTMGATVLIFITDLHLEVLRALHESYAGLTVDAAFDAQFGIVQIADAASRAFLVALQVASPFLVYSIIVNLLFGLANKLLPQVPVYFVSIPFVIAGGLALLILAIPEFLRIFMAAFAKWLATGKP